MKDYSYFDKLRNKERKFAPEEDRVIAEFARSKKTDSNELSHGLLPMNRDILDTSEKICKTIPVFIDEERLERHFLPDQCTVQFKENVGKTEIERIIKSCYCSVLIKHKTFNYYTVKINKNRDIFETIQCLSNFIEVEFAEPSEIDFDALSHTYYADKPTGKKLSFIPKNDELVVIYKADDTASSALPKFGILDLNDDTASIPDDADRRCPAMIDKDGLTRYFLPNECTVQFRADINREEAENVLNSTNCSILSKQRTEGYYIISVPEDRDFWVTVRQLIELDEVEFAEPSEVCSDNFAYRPISPMFEKLWGLNNTGQTIENKAGTSGIDIKLIEAWDITMGNPNVIIVIIDTGVNLDHPNLAANILPSNGEDWDFVPDSDEIPEDEHVAFHGTHVAGIAAAIDSSVGIIGVAPKCKLIPLRVTLKNGRNTDRVDALNYAVDIAKQNPSLHYVLNCSWVVDGDNAAIYRAITKAIENNILVIFAAGNDAWDMDNNKPRYPGVYPEVMAIAALDQNNKKVPLSNYGSQIDVCAPGENIWSTSGEGRYRFLTGTSMAAPHVAGVAALIWSVNPQLTNYEVRQIIESSCDEVDTANPQFSNKLGKGCINALKAINKALIH